EPDPPPPPKPKIPPPGPHGIYSEYATRPGESRSALIKYVDLHSKIPQQETGWVEERMRLREEFDKLPMEERDKWGLKTSPERWKDWSAQHGEQLSLFSEFKEVARPANGETRDEVPVAVYEQIAADAAKKWPGNYEMQAYTIEQQIEAY